MNRLKSVLVSVYVVLALLLVLNNLKCCNPPVDHPGVVNVDKIQDTGSRVEFPMPPPPQNSVPDERAVGRARNIGNMGDLKVTLLWDFPGDIDLYVMQPNGVTISYRNKVDNRTGGYLDVDNTRGGQGSAENVYWSTPESGVYSVKLHYYSRSSETGVAGSGICQVVVFRDGMQPMTFDVPMANVGTTRNVVEFRL